MDYSFSKALELSGANSTTTFVLWSMIIFLLLLIGGITFAVFKQVKKFSSNAKTYSSHPKKKVPKGFMSS